MVTTNTLAKYLNTTPASVTDMLKKLGERKLAEYVPYQGAKLTPAGKKFALEIIRKHRLWEVFLVKTLNFSWDNIHDTAEQLEHVNSPELVRKLDEFLGFPKFDPHGDPIPSEDGEIQGRKTFTLDEADSGQSVILAGVLNHIPEFLQYLDRIGLNLGKEISVNEKILFDGSVVITLGKKEIVLSGEVARHLLVMKKE